MLLNRHGPTSTRLQGKGLQMESFSYAKVLLVLALAAELLISNCRPATPTNITATGQIAGTRSNKFFSTTHDGVGRSPQSHLVISPPSDVGRLTSLSITTTREGTAPAIGYELSTVVNEFSVGGGGLLGLGEPGVAGDLGFHLKNTGKMAKVSYYWYDSPGESASFSIPTSEVFTPGNSWFARVRGDDKQALVPFTDTTGNPALFLTAGCLTGGSVPCFDIATLAGSIFTTFSGAFTTFADDDPNVALGGTNGNGNFRLDYIPSVDVLMGTCSNPELISGFGFVFTGTVVAAAGLASFDVSLPILFGIETVSAPNARNDFKVWVLPFDAVGSPCLERQAIGSIVVRANTPLGVGAREVASGVRTSLVCGLFGSSVATIDCPDDTPAAGSTPPGLILGLAAMVQNTLMFHHRKTHGDTRVQDRFRVYMRLRNADKRVTTTRMIPGTVSDCPGALDQTVGRPPMCMVDLLLLET